MPENTPAADPNTAALDRQALAHSTRKWAILSGLVPIWQLSQADVEWALAAAMRIGGGAE